MKYYKKITFWENKRRQKLLNEFSSYLAIYYKNIKSGYMSNDSIENSQALEARNKINLLLHEVHSIICLTGIRPVINYTPPPMIGGYIKNIDVLLNFHNLQYYEILSQDVLDFIVQATGIYIRDYKTSVIRTFNPIFWTVGVLDYIISLPFAILGWFGLSKQKTEESFLGKIFKGICRLATLIAALLAIFYYLDCLEAVKSYTHTIMARIVAWLT